MKNKTSIFFKILRNVCLICVISFGLITILGSGDAAEDLINEFADFNEEEDLDFQPLIVTESSGSGFGILAVNSECEETSINTVLDNAGIEDIDNVSINSVTLEYLQVQYQASWEGTPISLSCEFSLTGDGGDITDLSSTDIVIEGSASGWSDVTLNNEQIGVINTYLSNRDTTFEYCVECTDDPELDSYTITYYVRVGVTIDGDFEL